MQRTLTAALALAVLAVPAYAGKFNKKVTPGDTVVTWADLPGVDGRRHSLADLKDKDVVVLVVTCNSCPVAQSYQERLKEFTKKYACGADSKVAVVAVNVGKEDEDAFPEMVKRAKEEGYNFPYLHDAGQSLGRTLGATVTPEIFVLDRARKIVYTGAMDDSIRPAKVTETYLAPAVEAALKGAKPAVAETRPVGCGIQYERK